MFGRMLDQTLGWWHFWLTFLGINLTFIPLFGMWDMPRRIHVYEESAGWATEQMFSTIGSVVVFAAQVIFFWNFIRSMKSGDEADDNPWDATTFEWSTSSPPPANNFDELPEMMVEI
jgi:heme/copper-type cytochrome/quinol oxidase subunit 1